MVELLGFDNQGRDVSIFDSRGIGTILNDDSTSLSIDDVSLDEGNDGLRDAVFTISLTAPVDTELPGLLIPFPGTASSVDSDYMDTVDPTLQLGGTLGQTQESVYRFSVTIRWSLMKRSSSNCCTSTIWVELSRSTRALEWARFQ